VTIPRRCRRQTQRENYPAQNPQDYFRVSLYTQYRDQLIEELQVLFEDVRNTAGKMQHLIPYYICDSKFDDLQEMLDVYEGDLQNNSSVVMGEFDRWRLKWSSMPRNLRPKSAIAALNQCSVDFFPKIATLLCIFATLPVTTATAERTFSVLRQLKTYLRSVMGEERLNGLTSLKIHREISVNPEEIIDILAATRRRLGFILS